MRTAILRACGVALVGALGFGVAHGLVGPATAALPITTSVSLPTVTVPTLTVPTTTSATVPLPTTTVTVTTPPPPVTTPTTVAVPTTAVPAPTAPTVTAPAVTPPAATVPSPSAPAPRTTARTPSTAAPAAAPAAGASAPASQGSGGSSSGAAATPPSGSSAPSGTRGEQNAEPLRVRRFEASRERFRNRGEHRGATILRFRLSRDARLVLVVRGPGPSCEVVARIPLRGRAGANRYRFTGRIQGRPLAPGTYLLTPRLRGTHRPLGRELVTILAPGQSSAPHVAPRCGRGRDDVAPAAFPAAVDRIEAQRAALPDDIVVLVDAPPEPSPPRVGEVAGEATPATPALPLPAIARGVDELPPVLGIVLLALLAGSLVGVAAAVVHYLRSA